jgi:hypothetical protein
VFLRYPPIGAAALGRNQRLLLEKQEVALEKQEVAG